MNLLEISKKYWKVYKILLDQSFATEMEYRLNFVIKVTAGILSVVSYWIFIEILFLNFDAVGDWTKNEMLLAMAVFTFTHSVLKSTILHNLRTLGWKIPQGHFEVYLRRPISPLFLISFEDVKYFNFSESISGLILLVYAIIQGGFTITISGVVLCMISLVLLAVIFYCIQVAFFSLSFSWGKIDHAFWVFSELTKIGRLPSSVLRGVWGFLFVYLLPFVLYATVPAGLLIGKTDPRVLLLYILIAVFWAWFANYRWKRGLMKFVGAGG